MDKSKIARHLIRFVTSMSVGAVVSNAIKATTPPYFGGFVSKALVGIGEFVISGILADKAADYVIEEIQTNLGILKDEPEEEVKIVE